MPCRLASAGECSLVGFESDVDGREGKASQTREPGFTLLPTSAIAFRLGTGGSDEEPEI